MVDNVDTETAIAREYHRACQVVRLEIEATESQRETCWLFLRNHKKALIEKENRNARIERERQRNEENLRAFEDWFTPPSND